MHGEGVLSTGMCVQQRLLSIIESYRQSYLFCIRAVCQRYTFVFVIVISLYCFSEVVRGDWIGKFGTLQAAQLPKTS